MQDQSYFIAIYRYNNKEIRLMAMSRFTAAGIIPDRILLIAKRP
jgi:hypothetical protein